MKSVFYEVGACSALSHYLLKPEWATYFDDGDPSKRQYGWGPLIPASYAEFHSEWEIVLVEPNPIQCAELMKWITKKPQARLVTCAIAGDMGLNLMQEWDVRHNKSWGEPESTPIHQLERVAHIVPMGAPVINAFLVPTYTLDVLIASLGTPPTVLRIDIEGAEVEALEAYSFSPAPRMIQVDHHFVNLQAVRDILVGQGYTIRDEFADMGGDSNNLIAELSFDEWEARNAGVLLEQV